MGNGAQVSISVGDFMSWFSAYCNWPIGIYCSGTKVVVRFVELSYSTDISAWHKQCPPVFLSVGIEWHELSGRITVYGQSSYVRNVRTRIPLLRSSSLSFRELSVSTGRVPRSRVCRTFDASMSSTSCGSPFRLMRLGMRRGSPALPRLYLSLVRRCL